MKTHSVRLFEKDNAATLTTHIMKDHYDSL